MESFNSYHCVSGWKNEFSNKLYTYSLSRGVLVSEVGKN